MTGISFTLVKKSSCSNARLGFLQSTHGSFETPMFMPVGTRGVVKTLTEQQLKEIGAQIILGNTYHLLLRPGTKIIEMAGGLHSFARWDRTILTDSGGFQVFSLSDLRTVSDEGVHFKSHLDGSKQFLGPIESMSIQRSLGSDIVMCFDECPPSNASADVVEKAVERTVRWAKACRDFQLQGHQALFGIVQGGVCAKMRQQCAAALTSLPFEGFAIGGLSVGEPAEKMYEVIEATQPLLPQEKPRYLMGVGTPRNLFEAVLRGIDLFDCVMPSRNARGGTAFTWGGRIQIKAAKYAEDFSPLDPELDAYPSRFSKAYVRHLLHVNEITGLTLVTMQNVAFYLDFMKQLRQAIRDDTLDAFQKKVDAIYPI
jgi:queuine tRNA-ribosyltransferase